MSSHTLWWMWLLIDVGIKLAHVSKIHPLASRMLLQVAIMTTYSDESYDKSLIMTSFSFQWTCIRLI